MTVLSSRKPVLITGSHRSGSTWLAAMLALAEGTILAHEPFNVESWAYSLDGLATRWFTYAPALPQDAALEAFDKVIKQRTRKIYLKNQPQYWVPPLRRGRLIIKDPIAATSSDWIARNFQVEVVVLVRHPAAFTASLKRLGWRHPFDHFLEQEMLMQRHLEPYRAEIERKPDCVVSQAAILWKCLYGVLFDYLDANSNWLLRRHEDLSKNPVAELKDLYETLGLTWTKRVESGVVKYTSSSNPPNAAEGMIHQIRRDSAASVSQWRRILTRDEIARVYEATYPIACSYYPEEDWDVTDLSHTV